ncbi:MAG: hypothetical protein KatS3mg119_0909 [Rhodothalassiaceae bacterium]|nr:MAG: hypothetical protein KatS3mg119_0909 [Rhodothalassiaceae bacterium]
MAMTPARLSGMVAAVLLLAAAVAPAAPAGEETGLKVIRPAHTYSIVARDPETGQLGVAVQSHWFSVGSVVAWAKAGVGAVATQSFVEPSYGPLGLALMEAGKTAPEALKALLATDAHTDVRQVAMVDAHGHVAVHTGEHAIIAHCQITGEGFSVQANLMERDTVCTAMAKAFRETRGDLAARLMAALKAAEAEGGDIRGRQSAALLVVSGTRSGTPWAERIFDLRVEDSADPLGELERLLTLARAYHEMDAGDAAMTRGDMAAALEHYARAESLAPDNHEMVFWHAATLAANGRVEEALPLFAKAYAMWPKWRELVPRLPKSGLLPDDPALIARIVAAGREEGAR